MFYIKISLLTAKRQIYIKYGYVRINDLLFVETRRALCRDAARRVSTLLVIYTDMFITYID